MSRGFFRVLAPLLGVCVLVVVVGSRVAQAQPCQILRYTFQPDCLRVPYAPGCVGVLYKPDASDPTKPTTTIDRLDLGPQIAVWVETADRSSFIANVMVTNMVAARGIGNRPGLSLFVSSPKFPYGKRGMALPIWAYAQGVTYPSVVFQDQCSGEERIGFHESCSSPDGYYCRPMRTEDIVDAVTCPSPNFNSSKGRFDNTLPRSYYPPRNDLGTDSRSFVSRDCDNPSAGMSIDTCIADSESYSTMNNLDAVAAATPAYGQPYSGVWNIFPTLAPGDYALLVEVNKEFDRNASHSYTSTPDSGLAGYGLDGNFGQPSVVYRVPIHIDGVNTAVAATTQIWGYSGDLTKNSSSGGTVFTGVTGSVVARDSTISADPGSGEGRLKVISGSEGTGRVLVSVENCSSVVCDPPPPAPLAVTNLRVGDTVGDLTSSSATVRFQNGSAGGGVASGYEIRYLATDNPTMSEDEFKDAATRAPQVIPGSPGSDSMVTLDSLKPDTHYVVGVRTQGPCLGQSDIAMTDFTTTVMKFTQLSGCFVATAAYGSEMEPEVAALRAARDDLRPRSALFAAAIELYYRSGPAAAAVIKKSDTARALARRLIGPVADLADLAETARALTRR